MSTAAIIVTGIVVVVALISIPFWMLAIAAIREVNKYKEIE